MKEYSIKKRLILAFSVTVGIFLILVLFSSLQLGKLFYQTEKLYDHPFQVSNAVLRIDASILKKNLQISQIVENPDLNPNEVLIQIKSIDAQIDRDIKLAQERFLGDSITLVTFTEAYELLKGSYDEVIALINDDQRIEAKEKFNEETTVIFDSVKESIDGLTSFATKKGELFLIGARETKGITMLFFYLICFAGIVVIAWISYVVIKSITDPLNEAVKTADYIAQGDLTTKFSLEYKDEVSELVMSIQKIVDNIKKAADFAHEIGERKLDTDFETLGEHDTLGNALIEMRSQLKQLALEDEKRNWITKGLTNFAGLLRKDSSNIEGFGQSIISELVKYMNANQGGIFILNDEDPNDPYMNLVSAYAYDRQKFIERQVRKEEGLIGQCWQEKDLIYLTNIPESYIKIRTGLGKSYPRSVLIFPLLENEDIYGVIEIASYQPFEEHEIEFTRQLAQSIGATFKNLKTKIQTNKLLSESQNMGEMMREQEEELRQNAEEMKATSEQVQKETEKRQAEMDKVQRELNARLHVLNELCIVSETDKKGVITSVNEQFCKVAGYSQDELIEQPHNIVRHPDMPAEVFKAMWATIGKGKSFRGIVKNKCKDGSCYWVDACISPIVGEDGKPSGYIGVRYDITKEIQKFPTFKFSLDGKDYEIPTK